MALPTFTQKLLALFYPVKIRSGSTTLNPVLELYYFRGRYQLATQDALYSDGSRYRPLVAAFRALGDNFKQVKNVLVLGTGMGSAASVAARMGFHPHFTFVDLDETILEWAQEFLPARTAASARFVCADAIRFVRESTDTYEVIVVDVFVGRVVPDGIISNAFMQACKQRLPPGGRLILNYMVTATESASAIKALLGKAFMQVEEISFGLNRVYVAGV